MIQVGICDDEAGTLSKIEAFVKACYRENRFFAAVQGFDQGSALLYEIEDGARFDLLLLDIEMPGPDGMEIAARVKRLLPDVLIIFLTSHMEYALDAYELSVFRYIPKADFAERLSHALLDAAKLIEVQRRDACLIQNQNRLERIPLKNILYIVHEGKNALLVTDLLDAETGEKLCYKVRKTMQQVYRELGREEFLFIDRGCIVNLARIMSVREAVLKYNGSFFCRVENGRFVATAMLFFDLEGPGTGMENTG